MKNFRKFLLKLMDLVEKTALPAKNTVILRKDYQEQLQEKNDKVYTSEELLELTILTLQAERANYRFKMLLRVLFILGESCTKKEIYELKALTRATQRHLFKIDNSYKGSKVIKLLKQLEEEFAQIGDNINKRRK